MCGRYTLMTDEDYKDLEEIVREVSRTCLLYTSGLGDDLRLFFMVFRVEHHVRNAFLFEQLGQVLRLFDGNRTHQHGLVAFMAFGDLLDDGVEFALFRLINHVGQILADHRPVGGDLDDICLLYTSRCV